MIYTVKRGDTLFEIAQENNTSVEELIRLNGLTRPNDILPGQNLFIPSPTAQSTYTVVAGDTMYKIAQRFNIPLPTLISANPNIPNPNIIQIGETINIPNTKPNIEVNGYAIANINQDVLQRSLPYLTYLSIFSYQAKADGSLYGLYENELISQARNSSIAPNMVVTNISAEGGFDSDIAHEILTNQNIQQVLINNIISIAIDKNYYGVDIDFEYLYPEDRLNYAQFLRNLKSRLVENNLKLSVAVAPKYRDNQQGILYEAHDYALIGAIADRVIIMTYEWGYIYGEPMAVSPLSEMDAVISYAVTRIPSQKILMGMPNYAYDWITPFVSGTTAETLTNSRALERAIEYGANIMWDARSATPYYNYTDVSGKTHVVWFDDARSISAKLELVNKYNLAGVSYWTINNFMASNWAILDSMFNVTKLI